MAPSTSTWGPKELAVTADTDRGRWPSILSLCVTLEECWDLERVEVWI